MRNRKAEYCSKVLGWNDKVVEGEARRIFGGKPHKIVRRIPITRGATGAVTEKVDVLVREDTWHEASYCRKADVITGPSEVEGYKIIRLWRPQLFFEPCLTDAALGILWIPWLPLSKDLDSLIEDVSSVSEEDKKRIWGDFIGQMSSLWLETRERGQPDYKKWFLDRLDQRTQKAIDEMKDIKIGKRPMGFQELHRLPLLINSRPCPSLLDLVEIAKTVVLRFPAPFTVVAHRDEHLANIVVHTIPIGGRYEWYLVDLPNVSLSSDWVYSLGKMTHWLRGYYAVNRYKKLPPKRMIDLDYECETDGKLLVINFNLSKHIPTLCGTMDEQVIRSADCLAELMEDPNWQKRFPAMLFSAFYTGVTNHNEYRHVIPLLLGLAAEAMLPILNL